MLKNRLPRSLGYVVAGCTLAVPVLAQNGADTAVLIRVTEGQSAEAARLSAAAVQSEPVARLSSNASVSLSRMGGRGLDPVVRGQNEERVDVLLDGMRVEGACPSRMDPATNRLSVALAPTLEVRTGNRTLRWGPIAGGRIVATTAAPVFADDNVTAGHIAIGGADNGEGKLVNGSVAVGHNEAFLRLAGGYDESDDYQDGDGTDVRSSYENSEGRIDAAWTAQNGFFIKGMASRQEERDVSFPGRGMDAPITDTDLYRLEVGAPVTDGSWNLMLWKADVDHVMDNFSLRQAMMKMQTNSKTRTEGARLVLDQTLNDTNDIALGIDVERNDWDATMFNGMALANEASLMWPGVERERVGVFVEGFHQIRANARLGAGVRYDRIEMDATRAGQRFTPMLGGMMSFTPAELYASTYGTDRVSANDDNVSGFMTGAWRFSPGQALEVTASHSARSPGVNERYVARKTMSGSWVGNPGLDVEKHNKLDVTLSGRAGNWHWRPSLWVDQVDDYVLRSESRYYNVDARLLGVEGEFGWSNGTWSTTSRFASVRGENRDDDQALSRIPPIQFNQTVAWTHQGHALAIEWQLARRQDRVYLEEDGGLDPATSPGYGVLNLTGSHPLMTNLSLTWAVDNVFDKTWARHVSKDNLSDEGVYRVNEPGRTVRAALTARW